MRLRRRRALNPRLTLGIFVLYVSSYGTNPLVRFLPSPRKGDFLPLTKGVCNNQERTGALELVREERLHLLLLRFVDDLGAAQAALALGRLVREQMALVRLLVLDVSPRGDFEAL